MYSLEYFNLDQGNKNYTGRVYNADMGEAGKGSCFT